MISGGIYELETRVCLINLIPKKKSNIVLRNGRIELKDKIGTHNKYLVSRRRLKLGTDIREYTVGNLPNVAMATN